MQLSRRQLEGSYTCHAMSCMLFDIANKQHPKDCLVVVPVTHMPEKLYMSRATMSTRRTIAMGLE